MPRGSKPLRPDAPESSTLPSFCSLLKTGYERTGCSFDDGLLLAVSGGADSVALLHGTLEIQPDCRARIAVAHVNHGLRGKDSDQDAEFVQQLAETAGVTLQSLTLKAGELQERGGVSVEEAARHARYEFLTRTAIQLNLSTVVTAHHCQDQAETILHNIIRGTGLRGLRGMLPVRPLADELCLARPMLEIPREAVKDYLTAGQWGFREDSSNCDTRFMRNRIRRQLLPLLRTDFNTQIDRHLLSLGRHAAESLEAIDLLASQILDETTLECQPDVCRLSKQRLMKWPLPLVRQALSLLWTSQHWPRQKMTSEHWERIVEGIVRDQFRTHLPGGLELTVADGIVRFQRQTA